MSRRGGRNAPSLTPGGKRIHFLCESMDANRSRSRCITQSDVRFGDLANTLGLVRQRLNGPCCEIPWALPWIAWHPDVGELLTKACIQRLNPIGARPRPQLHPPSISD